jgi:hypothetical protein
MIENKQLAILGQCISLKKNAQDLLDKIDESQIAYIEAVHERENNPIMTFSSDTEKTILKRMELIGPEVSTLINKYNQHSHEFSKELGIQIYALQPKTSMEAACRELIVDCDKIITVLHEKQSPLTHKEMDKLNHIRKEITSICESIDINFEKNLDKSVELSECGQFLGSALITSRVVAYIIDKISGKNIDEKIKTLIDSSVLKKDDDKTKEQIIKASKKSRNYLTHRIDTFAEPSDAMSLLGDCITLLKIYEKLPE